jgi:hypothetical protein
MKLTSRGKAIIAGAAIACASALVPAVAMASPAAPQAPQIRQCGVGGILDWLANAPQGAAGTIFYPVEFTNVSGRTCWLRGYPRVAGVTTRLRQIGPAAAHFGGRIRKVTLRPNQTAHASLGIVVAGIIAGCHARTGAGLALNQPGSRSRQFVMNFTFPACTNRVYMRVSPVPRVIGVP